MLCIVFSTLDRSLDRVFTKLEAAQWQPGLVESCTSS